MPSAAKVDALRRHGMSADAIAQRFGISRRKIYQLLSEAATKTAAEAAPERSQ